MAGESDFGQPPFGAQQALSPEQMPIGAQCHPDLLKHLLNSEDELLSFRLYLEGKAIIINPTTGDEELRQCSEPIMNARGIHDVMTFLSSVCRKGLHGSNIDEDEMYGDMLISADSIATKIFKDMVGENKYNLRKENFDILVEETINFIEFSMRRPLNQGERELFKQNIKSEQTIRSVPLEQPRGKFLGIIPL